MSVCGPLDPLPLSRSASRAEIRPVDGAQAPGTAELDRPLLTGLGVELLLLTPPALLLQGRREVFRELPEGLALGQGLLDRPP